MKRNSIYTILIGPAVISAIIIYLAFYSVGVVEKNLAADNAADYISSLIANIYEDSTEYQQITDSLCTEYELKAKTLSVLVSQLPKTLSEDMTSEELRIASGADEIMISDKKGVIIFSTSPESEVKSVDERFSEGLTQKNYCKTVLNNSDDGCVFEVAVSRRNEGGLIIARFTNSALNEVFTYNDSSYAIHRNTSFNAGTTAIISLTDNRYIAHTNADLIGTDCIIPADRFRQKSGYFSYRYQHVPSFVFYEFYNDDTVLITIISKEFVYTKRTLVLAWLLVLDFTLLLSVFLSARSFRNNN